MGIGGMWGSPDAWFYLEFLWSWTTCLPTFRNGGLASILVGVKDGLGGEWTLFLQPDYFLTLEVVWTRGGWQWKPLGQQRQWIAKVCEVEAFEPQWETYLLPKPRNLERKVKEPDPGEKMLWSPKQKNLIPNTRGAEIIEARLLY